MKLDVFTLMSELDAWSGSHARRDLGILEWSLGKITVYLAPDTSTPAGTVCVGVTLCLRETAFTSSSGYRVVPINEFMPALKRLYTDAESYTIKSTRASPVHAFMTATRRVTD